MIRQPLHPAPLLALALLALGCPTTPAPDQKPAASDRPQATAATRGDGPEFVAAPESGDVIEIVAAAQTKAAAEDRTLLVYVGASWCEPCRYFHAAVEDGRLDDSLAGVRLLEFDLDRDRERLRAAGYSSKMIPLFVAPGPDGRPGPRRTAGGVKGPAAVDNLRPRLVALVEAARADQASRDSREAPKPPGSPPPN